MPASQPTRLICILAIALAMVWAGDAPAQSRPGEWNILEEHWYVLEFDGRRAGWASDVVFDDGAQYRSTSEQYLAYQRGPNDRVEIALRIEQIETHAGEPVSIEATWKLSDAPLRQRWTFEPTAVQEVTNQGGRESTRQIARPPGDWLMPYAAARFEAARRRSGAQAIEYQTPDVSSGLRIAHIRETLQGAESIETSGRAIPVSVWRVERSHEGSDVVSLSEVRISEDDVVVRAEERMGAMTLTMRLASKAEAQRAVLRPPELLVRTFVHPDRRIARADRARVAEYRVRSTSGDTLDFPSAGSQRVERADNDHAARIVVDIDHPLEALADDVGYAGYLAPSRLIDAEDPAIVELKDRTLRRAPEDQARRANLLWAATHRHINRKGLATAFASASEAVRDRDGDCSEHALLLCALLRADQIPARVATGLIYADTFAGERDIFAWHMWTQALIDGRWVDFDATMSRPFSAAHILTSTSDLADGAVNDEFVRAASLIGTIAIDVIDVGRVRRDLIKEDK